MAIRNSRWGLLTDRYYDVTTLPEFRADSFEDLQTLLSEQFGTTVRYLPGTTLVGTVARYLNAPYTPTTSQLAPAAGLFQAECLNDGSGIVRDLHYIGSLDAGDWVRYNVGGASRDFNTFAANLGTENAGGQILVRFNAITGTVAATMTVAATGSWWIFTEQQTPISYTTGIHDIFLTFAGNGGVANVDWFVFRGPRLYLPVVLRSNPFEGNSS